MALAATAAAPVGREAGGMRLVLRAALQALERNALDRLQEQALADYLEAMALASADRWFSPPDGLAWASAEFFAVADRLMDRVGDDPARRSDAAPVCAAMTVLVQHVISFAGVLGMQASPAIEPPMLDTAASACRRVRAWIEPAAPGRAQMLSVAIYALVGATTQAVSALEQPSLKSGSERRERTACEAIARALAEAVEASEQLMGEHPDGASDWLEGLTVPQREPSRLVRSLHGVAWGYHVIGRRGCAVGDALGPVEERLVQLWPHAVRNAVELGGLLGAQAQLCGAAATALDGRSRHALTVALRALWFARQASGQFRSDVEVAERMLEVVQAVCALSGLAIDRGMSREVRLALHAAELLERLFSEPLPVGAPALLDALCNLAAVGALAAQRRLGESAALLGRCLAAFQHWSAKGSRERPELRRAARALVHLGEGARDCCERGTPLEPEQLATLVVELESLWWGAGLHAPERDRHLAECVLLGSQHLRASCQALERRMTGETVDQHRRRALRAVDLAASELASRAIHVLGPAAAQG